MDLDNYSQIQMTVHITINKYILSYYFFKVFSGSESSDHSRESISDDFSWFNNNSRLGFIA